MKRKAELTDSPWCTIESDPAVFNALLTGFGTTGLSVEEVFSCCAADIGADGPVHGIILASRSEQDSPLPDNYNEDDPDNKKVFFSCQVVTNMCATLALLGIVFNIANKIDIGKTLRDIMEFIADFDPLNRGLALGGHPILRDTHNSFASSQERAKVFSAMQETEQRKKRKGTPGRKKKVVTEDEVVYHYTSYIPKDGFLWELDGLRRAPLKVAECTESNWLEVLEPILLAKMEGGDIDFSMLKVVPNRLGLVQAEIGELEKIQTTIQTKLNDMNPEWQTEQNDLLRQRYPWTSPAFQEHLENASEADLIVTYNSLLLQMDISRHRREQLISDSSLDILNNSRRTHNYNRFIRLLMTKLHQNGSLQKLIETKTSTSTP